MAVNTIKISDELKVLLTLYVESKEKQTENGLSLKMLMNRIGISKEALTGITKNLTSKGFIEVQKITSKTKKKINYYTLSSKGSRLIKNLLDKASDEFVVYKGPNMELIDADGTDIIKEGDTLYVKVHLISAFIEQDLPIEKILLYCKGDIFTLEGPSEGESSEDEEEEGGEKTEEKKEGKAEEKKEETPEPQPQEQKEEREKEPSPAPSKEETPPPSPDEPTGGKAVEKVESPTETQADVETGANIGVASDAKGLNEQTSEKKVEATLQPQTAPLEAMPPQSPAEESYASRVLRTITPESIAELTKPKELFPPVFLSDVLDEFLESGQKLLAIVADDPIGVVFQVEKYFDSYGTGSRKVVKIDLRPQSYPTDIVNMMAAALDSAGKPTLKNIIKSSSSPCNYYPLPPEKMIDIIAKEIENDLILVIEGLEGIPPKSFGFIEKLIQVLLNKAAKVITTSSPARLPIDRKSAMENTNTRVLVVKKLPEEVLSLIIAEHSPMGHEGATDIIRFGGGHPLHIVLACTSQNITQFVEMSKDKDFTPMDFKTYFTQIIVPELTDSQNEVLRKLAVWSAPLPEESLTSLNISKEDMDELVRRQIVLSYTRGDLRAHTGHARDEGKTEKVQSPKNTLKYYLIRHSLKEYVLETIEQEELKKIRSEMCSYILSYLHSLAESGGISEGSCELLFHLLEEIVNNKIVEHAIPATVQLIPKLTSDAHYYYFDLVSFVEQIQALLDANIEAKVKAQYLGLKGLLMQKTGQMANAKTALALAELLLENIADKDMVFYASVLKRVSSLYRLEENTVLAYRYAVLSDRADTSPDDNKLGLLGELCALSAMCGDKDAALSYKERLDKVLESGEASYEKVCAYEGLGEMYHFLKEYEQAKENYAKALSIAGDIEDRYLECRLLIKTGQTHIGAGAVEEAKHVFSEAMELATMLALKLEEANLLIMQAGIADGNERIKYLSDAKSIFESLGNRMMLSKVSRMLES